jgi:hypothetical protein
MRHVCTTDTQFGSVFVWSSVGPRRVADGRKESNNKQTDMSEYESRPGANDGKHLPMTINTTRDDIEKHLTSLQTRPTRLLRPVDAGAASETLWLLIGSGGWGTRSDLLFYLQLSGGCGVCWWNTWNACNGWNVLRLLLDLIATKRKAKRETNSAGRTVNQWKKSSVVLVQSRRLP